MKASALGFLRGALPIALGALISAAPLLAQGDGASLFKSKCAACHGADGSGNTAVGKSLKLKDMASADVQKQTDADLTAMITNGKGAMPSYKDKLTADQIKQVVAFIRSLAKKG
ncbi:MAG TPA: cytochrome c [Candidatus Aquilonibacter sp.]|nr:cytochrome c [Candidatus Aquilonibacter sp.]